MPNFIDTKGVNIYYEIHGQEDKPAIILLHGLGSDSTIWNPQVVEFQKHFQVYLMDFPGHGRSGRQKRYSIHEFPAVVKQLMNHVGLEKAHLAGLSIGSTVCILFAATYPEAVLSLVLQGPAGGIYSFSSPVGWVKWIQLRLTINTIILLWALLGRRNAGKVINWVGQTYQYSTMLTGMEERMDTQALRDLAYTNADTPYDKNLLHQVRANTLIIRGSDDTFPSRYSQYIQENIDALCLWIEIPEAQHLVALEKPLEFNLTVLAFIQKVDHGDLVEIAQELGLISQSIKNNRNI